MMLHDFKSLVFQVLMDNCLKQSDLRKDDMDYSVSDKIT